MDKVRDSLKDTARCVMCGLCLPHCPTYREARNEAESPRGRVALMQALNQGTTPLNRAMREHLDACLLCRACEHVCPARVPFGALMDEARARIHSRTVTVRALALILAYPWVRHRWLRRAAGLGLGFLTRVPPVRRRLPRLLAHSLNQNRPWLDYESPGSHTDEPTVGLFTGCVAEVVDRDTLDASLQCLQALGYRVRVPADQTCCGALHRHNGATRLARRLMRRNTRAFGLDGMDAVISTATGCGALLGETCRTGCGGTATNLSRRHHDITEFLADSAWPDRPILQPLRARVAIHTPCTQVHVLKSATSTERLLRRIPGIDLVPLPHNDRCCGAAGSYTLTHPNLAGRLVWEKVEAIRRSGAGIVVTANVGCRIHLLDGMARDCPEIEVLHPATLIARQLHDTRAPADSRRHVPE